MEMWYMDLPFKGTPKKRRAWAYGPVLLRPLISNVRGPYAVFEKGNVCRVVLVALPGCGIAILGDDGVERTQI